MAADDSMSSSQSQLLPPTSTLSPSKICSKTYKKASQLFLTRRLQETLTTIEPILTVSQPNDDQYANGDESLPPIAVAQATWRIKTWNLYITLLSAILDLGPEEGKATFGQKEWKAISAKVREGEIWETVVQTGYKGREGSVDAEVVYNLATLLLNHSPSQKLNQQRLETYLSSYVPPSLDIAEHLQNSPSQQSKARVNGGTDTPKDLAARVRIIELFTLHVLPRNEEWDYASEFINLSEILDEERKDIFLQTLDGLKEEKEQGKLRAAALQKEKDAELERQMRKTERQRTEEEAATAERPRKGHTRNNSEVDYGIEKTNPNGSVKGREKGEKQASSKNSTSSNRTPFSPTGSKNIKRPEKPVSRPGQTRALANVLRKLFRYVSNTISGNPLSFARTLLFLLGLLAALSRSDVRERLRRITGAGWQKVKGTVGMGVKVSYI
ncbi:peroxisome proliferation protein peroxin 26 [Aspergillus coremiiformis]|uniref:Peroxisome proliferation protein peroxin 26 n=1 Tax=Aspergillus coremiiformis TaxID=138285 RepID=A0A5N6YZX5_9EURO|nr:peroxisome proliferation protein peroxin 26 [Aspergillus coremiiformis]